jgi:glucose-6-phosphate dehydrogenase assembly protein OpcA
VDRLIFDSQIWNHPKEQFEVICQIASITDDRTILCDLNWTRGFHVRETLACLFDSPANLRELEFMETLRIAHGPHYRTTALLLLGWLSDRLGWRLVLAGKNPQFQNNRGGLISVSLEESEGASMSRIRLVSPRATFEIARESNPDLYVTSARGEAIGSATCKIRAPREGTSELLFAELARSSSHSLYSRAVKAVEALWD